MQPKPEPCRHKKCRFRVPLAAATIEARTPRSSWRRGSPPAPRSRTKVKKARPQVMTCGNHIPAPGTGERITAREPALPCGRNSRFSRDDDQSAIDRDARPRNRPAGRGKSPGRSTGVLPGLHYADGLLHPARGSAAARWRAARKSGARRAEAQAQTGPAVRPMLAAADPQLPEIDDSLLRR